VARALDTLLAWQSRAAERRQLAELSDRELFDMGLDRATAIGEAGKPFWRAEARETRIPVSTVGAARSAAPRFSGVEAWAMKLYSGPLSLFARKVEFALYEKGLNFERVMVPFTQEAGYAPKHPAVLAANPKGQVPVLEDGDLTLFDSTLILEYLEDAYPAPPLYPRDARDKARCRLIELEADEILLPPIRSLMYRNAPADPDPARQEARAAEGRRGEAAIREHYARLDRRLEGRDYFFAAFGVADIAMFMMVLWALRLGGPRLDGHPALARWYARTCARPAGRTVAAEIAAADRELSPLARAAR